MPKQIIITAKSHSYTVDAPSNLHSGSVATFGTTANIIVNAEVGDKFGPGLNPAYDDVGKFAIGPGLRKYPVDTMVKIVNLISDKDDKEYYVLVGEKLVTKGSKVESNHAIDGQLAMELAVKHIEKIKAEADATYNNNFTET